MSKRAVISLRIPGFCRVEAHLSDDAPSETRIPVARAIDTSGEAVGPQLVKARPRRNSGVLQLVAGGRRRAS